MCTVTLDTYLLKMNVYYTAGRLSVHDLFVTFGNIKSLYAGRGRQQISRGTSVPLELGQ